MCTFYCKDTEYCSCKFTEMSTGHNLQQGESRFSLNVTPRYVELYIRAAFPLLSSSFDLANHTLVALNTFYFMKVYQ